VVERRRNRATGRRCTAAARLSWRFFDSGWRSSCLRPLRSWSASYCLMPPTAFPPYASLLGWRGWTPHLHIGANNFVRILTDPLYSNAFPLSLKVAGLSTLACLLLGYPMALAIACAPVHQRGTLLLAMMLPFWTGFLMCINAWIGLLPPKRCRCRQAARELMQLTPRRVPKLRSVRRVAQATRPSAPTSQTRVAAIAADLYAARMACVCADHCAADGPGAGVCLSPCHWTMWWWQAFPRAPARQHYRWWSSRRCVSARRRSCMR
jgi:hypothetical protein